MNGRNHPARPGILIGGGLLVALLAGLWISTWWNRYLAPSSAGDLFVADLLIEGKMPYRDFFSFGLPLPLLRDAAIVSVAGRSLRALWLFGAAERILGATLLFLWLARRFHPASAFVASLATAVASSGDTADTPLQYNTETTILAVVAGFTAALALAEERPGRRTLADLGVGFLLGLGLLAKQTTGLAVALVVVTVLGAVDARSRGGRAALARLSRLAIGSALPLGLAVVWLANGGALDAALRTFSVGAAASKGGVAATLLRPLVSTLAIARLERAGAAALLLTALALLLVVMGPRLSESSSGWRSGRIATAVAAAMLFAAGAAGLVGEGYSFRTPQLVAVYLALVGCAILAASGLITALVRRVERDEAELLLLSGVGFAVAFALAISWPAFEVMAFPGLAVIGCWALDRLGTLRPRALPVAALLLALIGLTAASMYRKNRSPYSWYWGEPPLRFSTTAARIPELRGFLLSPGTNAFYERVVALAAAHTRDGDGLFAFPVMPVFYSLTGRRPPTFAFMHWFDTCPDDLAVADARRLLESPPAMIVAEEWEPEKIRFHEEMFRGGRPSGQRALASAVRTLAERYVLVDRFVRPGSSPIGVWIRPDRMPSPP